MREREGKRESEEAFCIDLEEKIREKREREEKAVGSTKKNEDEING